MIFLKLILAHLFGDFLFQPDKWVLDKEQKKIKSKYLYFHILLHVFLVFIFLWDLSLWYIPLIIGVSHYLIDISKLYFQSKKTKRWLFFIDQFLHLSVIIVISTYFKEIDFNFLNNPIFLKYLVAAVFLTVPTSIFIKNLLAAWSPIVIEHSKIQTDSLVNAGKYIGILERLLVFTFIIINHWEGVGFMIAAKSVFRFSDLAEAKQRKLTEYVLIGTLLSFGIAVITGIIVNIF
ncbi:DUF3307 domain-containing protein [Halpernia frigidisoli]|uniref:DUF3307 domain-containing protein n=1 Tax=Halpernia frigidisoli TaxID=1125876 RepID=A0A1I3EAS5_9FLAO|nr:DUF3307 domain-containing protein [Halpernia frigidisoli]SFH96018.1 Protein of unknown function [Halpernia frigidisoli]